MSWDVIGRGVDRLSSGIPLYSSTSRFEPGPALWKITDKDASETPNIDPWGYLDASKERLDEALKISNRDTKLVKRLDKQARAHNIEERLIGKQAVENEKIIDKARNEYTLGLVNRNRRSLRGYGLEAKEKKLQRVFEKREGILAEMDRLQKLADEATSEHDADVFRAKINELLGPAAKLWERTERIRSEIDANRRNRDTSYDKSRNIKRLAAQLPADSPATPLLSNWSQYLGGLPIQSRAFKPELQGILTSRFSLPGTLDEYRKRLVFRPLGSPYYAPAQKPSQKRLSIPTNIALSSTPITTPVRESAKGKEKIKEYEHEYPDLSPFTPRVLELPSLI